MTSVHRYYSQDLFLRAAAVRSTSVVLEMATLQQMGPLATLAAGRVLTGSLLMASGLKEGQMIGLHFRGDGALGAVYAEASFEGEVRGWCDRPEADLPLKDGTFDIAGGVGRGFLHVTRSQPFEKVPHVSSVEIVSGQVGDDLAYYLHQSLQIPSVIALGASTDDRGVLTAAGGVLIELMPGAPESTIVRLEEQVAGAQSLSHLLAGGADEDDLLRNFVGDIKMNAIPHPFEARYTCRCNIERVERSLTLMGPDQLRSFIEEGKPANARCEFCGRTYVVPLVRLQVLLDEMIVQH